MPLSILSLANVSMASSDETKKAMRLLEAASSGNLRLLKEVVKELNEGEAQGIADKIKGITDVNGATAFHLAAYHGRTDICQYFVQDLGFPADFSSDYGDTPLFDAAMGGHATIARYLLSHGANPVALNRQGVNGAENTEFTPILSSVHAGSLECTKLIIKAGADLNINCPLAMACNRGLIEIVKCLLEAGADPNIRNENGWLPIETAGLGKKWDIVEMLFPLTSPVPEVLDWSVQRMLKYVKSNAFKKKNEEIFGKNLADLKVKGADLFKKKEYAYAYFIYDKAIGIASFIGSGDATLFSNRSLCSYQMGEGYRAWKDALAAQRLRPDWPKAYYCIGAALMLLMDYEQASRAFMDGLQLDPTNREMKEAHREAVDCLKETLLGEERVIW
ncbi:hypothetical protein LUZ63_015990 [Rhynchospora breviuscula]|uniref:Ankyrin repeat protein n=1 Tax=Rhynchospora breviuscula TaxID=2022672 RepID=A0A9Q0CDP9_9POAL|nr:hypothetical protein LUZ63_015990 [Rhynchospora breviuscula]